MDPRHRQLLGPKDHLQLRQQVKAYLPFFLVITFFDIYLQVFVQFSYIRKNVEFLLKMLIFLCSSFIHPFFWLLPFFMQRFIYLFM